MNLRDLVNAGQRIDEKIFENIEASKLQSKERELFRGNVETQRSVKELNVQITKANNLIKMYEIKVSSQCNQIEQLENETRTETQNIQDIEHFIKKQTEKCLKLRQLSADYEKNHENQVLLLKKQIEEETTKRNNLLNNTELLEKSIAAIPENNEPGADASNDLQNAEEEVKVNANRLEEAQKATILAESNIEYIDKEIEFLENNNKKLKNEISMLKEAININDENKKQFGSLLGDNLKEMELKLNVLQTTFNSEELLKQEHASQISEVEANLDTLRKEFAINSANICNKFNISKDTFQSDLNQKQFAKSQELYETAKNIVDDKSQEEQNLLQTIKSLDEQLYQAQANNEEISKQLHEIIQQTTLDESQILDNVQLQEEQKDLIRQYEEKLELQTKDLDSLANELDLMTEKINSDIANEQRVSDEKKLENKNKHDVLVQEKLSLEENISGLNEKIARVNGLIAEAQKKKEGFIEKCNKSKSSLSTSMKPPEDRRVRFNPHISEREITDDSQSTIQTQELAPNLN